MEPVILLAPLLGAIVCGFGWRILGERTAIVFTTATVWLAMLLAWVVFYTLPEEVQHIRLFPWVESGTLISEWAIRLDRLTAIMLIVVTTVSALVHLYSFGYMDHDPEWKPGEVYKPRFFAYLSFFTFAMLALVTADNLLQMFFGWEGVGVASYLLIGFYYRKPSASAAAIKAFIVNRVGDFGFILGIAALYLMTDSILFDDIFAQVARLADTPMTFLGMTFRSSVELIGFLLFVGAMGKSAQLFLHTWLPDAMEGPTPVSALIHAATMVTAGVFLVSRMSPLYEYAPTAAAFVTVIGATTALFAATVGLVQNDIKRVIAYSTCSQLGYMFAAAGVGVYQAAMFHLFTHAFFKALLFLGAGSVIHAMHHEQDMRKYGGLRHKIPLTFWGMMIGTLAITGVGIPGTEIGFAGFLSKDAIIESTIAAHSGVGMYAFWVLVIVAALTSFYSWRLMFLTFFGEPRERGKYEHAHESPWVMTVPLGVLSLGAILAGMIWYGDFVGEAWREFFGPSIILSEHNEVLEAMHHLSFWAKVAPFVAMLIGFFVAWLFYIRDPSLPRRLAENQKLLYRFLYNKWYFDEIYDFVFVRGALRLGRFLWKKGDEAVIDGFINAVALRAVPAITRLYQRAQSGYLFHYAFAMVMGVVALVTWIMMRGGIE